jgi:hypothetical protein
MKHLLVGVYEICSNKIPGVKIGPPQGVIVFPYTCMYMYIVKFLKSSFKNLKELELRYLA